MDEGQLERDVVVMVARPGVGMPVVGMPGTTLSSRHYKHAGSAEGRDAWLSHDAAKTNVPLETRRLCDGFGGTAHYARIGEEWWCAFQRVW